MEESGFSMPVAELEDEGWSLADSGLLRLRDKIKAAGKPLSEYLDEGMYRGIVTGFNDAFVIDADTRARLIAEDPKSEELIRPWLRGRDVRRWRAFWAGLYVIFHAPGHGHRTIPRCQAASCRNSAAILKPKSRRGAGRGRKPGSYQWFEIQDDIAYYKAFESAKDHLSRYRKRNESIS